MHKKLPIASSNLHTASNSIYGHLPSRCYTPNMWDLRSNNLPSNTPNFSTETTESLTSDGSEDLSDSSKPFLSNGNVSPHTEMASSELNIKDNILLPELDISKFNDPPGIYKSLPVHFDNPPPGPYVTPANSPPRPDDYKVIPNFSQRANQLISLPVDSLTDHLNSQKFNPQTSQPFTPQYSRNTSQQFNQHFNHVNPQQNFNHQFNRPLNNYISRNPSQRFQYYNSMQMQRNSTKTPLLTHNSEAADLNRKNYDSSNPLDLQTSVDSLIHYQSPTLPQFNNLPDSRRWQPIGNESV